MLGKWRDERDEPHLTHRALRHATHADSHLIDTAQTHVSHTAHLAHIWHSGASHLATPSCHLRRTHRADSAQTKADPPIRSSGSLHGLLICADGVAHIACIL